MTIPAKQYGAVLGDWLRVTVSLWHAANHPELYGGQEALKERHFRWTNLSVAASLKTVRNGGY